jgi:hypothetical protein
LAFAARVAEPSRMSVPAPRRVMVAYWPVSLRVAPVWPVKTIASSGVPVLSVAEAVVTPK